MMTPKVPRAWIEMVPDQSCRMLDAVVTPRRARHTPETNPTAVSVEIGGKVVAYSGDTEWTAPGDRS